MPIVVTVIDTSHFVGWLAAVTYLDEVEMASVEDMVDKVIARLEATRERPPGNAPPPRRFDGMVAASMSRLNVIDHGNNEQIKIGKDLVDTGSFPRFRDTLARLTPRFAPGAFAHLQHCDLGQNIRLMELFADTWRVPIVAGTDMDNAHFRVNHGNYVRVHPVRPGGDRPKADTFFWRP